MCDDDSVIWPSTLPPCPVATAIVQAVQIEMARMLDQSWQEPQPVYGEARKPEGK